MSFFASINEDGEYIFTTAGYVALAVIMLAVFLTGCSLLTKNRKINTRQLVFSAMAMALAMVTSTFCKIIHMPMGGSVTLFSMLFITLIGYWYGLSAGLTCAVAYGFLQLVTNPYVVSLPQAVTDYILAFGALGLSGIFHKNRQIGMQVGYVAGVLGRFVFSVLSGVIFFGAYAPNTFPNPLVYSIAYNGAYLGLEMVLTLIVISLPPVKKALESVKKLACTTGDGAKKG